MDILTHAQRQIYIDRIKMILFNLRHCNNGADIHLVANIRNCASILIELLNTEELLYKHDVERIVINSERACVAFFHKKYSSY